MKKIFLYLNSQKVYYSLLAATIAIAVVAFSLGLSNRFNDEIGYINMGKSFGYGTFSSWYFLPAPPPETLRIWGYPFFLFLCQQVSESLLVPQFIQLISYIAAVFLILKTIAYFKAPLIHRNVFLIMLLPNIKIPFYSGQIGAEALCIFFIALYVYIYFVYKEGITKYILLALNCFIIFQLRPAFLLFPFLLIGYKICFDRNKLKFHTFSITLYLLLLLPFAFWNYNNHGIFKATPIEGGAGIAHMGFWCYKLPEGYEEKFYWGNICTADYTKPTFQNNEEIEQNVTEFEKEWGEINSKIQPYLNSDDDKRLELMKQNNPGQFIIYNGKYTRERENLLFQKTFEHIKKEPVFYIKTRIHTFFRLWFTGIEKNSWMSANTLTQKIKILYPFISTFIFILLNLIFCFIFLFLKPSNWGNYYFLFLLILYFGVIHIPFAYQSRFTVPVNLLILLISSMFLPECMAIFSNYYQIKIKSLIAAKENN